jgi:RNA methyltransferase, TrmH family
MRVLSTARDLQRRNARERQGLFVAEGIRAVDELLRSPLVVRSALVVDDGEHLRRRTIVTALRDRGIPVEDVSATDFASAADTDTPQGILAIAEIPKRGLATLAIPNVEPVRLLVLDAVQDPGNVGTILRTAAALGAVATLALPGTVDLWNAKVVRSSMGALFHYPALACTWEELGSFLSRYGAVLWGAEADGEPLSTVVRSHADIPRRLAVAVGNEGSGLSAHTRDGASKLVAVEIGPDVESLNVAVATGIMLYELRR